MKLPAIETVHRLDEVYPSHAVQLSTFWPDNPWLPDHPSHFRTGTLRPIAGALAVLCPHACTSPAGEALYELGNVPVSRACVFAPERFEQRLDALHAEGRPIASDHAPPTRWAERWSWANPPALLAALNDKARLDELAPRGAAPERRVVPRHALAELHELEPPIVLKAATWHSTGGGLDVRLCRTREALREAVGFFASRAHDLDGVVVERFECFRATWCAVFGVSETGWTPWGAAQQICEDQGAYGGNWCGRGFEMPERAWELVQHVAEQGRARGYRGVAGLDLGETADGRLRIFDLNFRPNGCLAQVLLHASACARSGAAASRYGRFFFEGPLARAVAALRPLVERGLVVPLGSIDASCGPSPDGLSSIAALVLGEDREDTERRFGSLVALG